MATAFVSPITVQLPTDVENRGVLTASNGVSKSFFLQTTKLLSPLPSLSFSGRSKSGKRKGFKATCVQKSSFDNIPKQFREENLKDGLMDNYKNAPQYLYGLSPSQMDMFTTEDNPVQRLSETVTEESISSARSYLDHCGMSSIRGMADKSPKCSLSLSMYRGGVRRYGTRRSAPPDLPSLLLDARIVILGMPIFPAVAELLCAQFMWLDYDNPSKPIYLYINSSGTQNEKMETVGSDADAYIIADAIAMCKSNVYTVNYGTAFGQAAMLMSLGLKGKRAFVPHAVAKIYLPRVHRSSGSVSDMWIKAKELDANIEYCVELFAKGVGKSKEEMRKDLEASKLLRGQAAIDYGIADMFVYSLDGSFEKKDYDEMLARSKAMRRTAGAGPQANPFGYR